MSAAGIPIIDGSIVLSGTEAIAIHYKDAFAPHDMPGREGAIVERTGSNADRLQIKGRLAYPDTEEKMRQIQGIQGLSGGVHSITIHSFASDYFFIPEEAGFRVEKMLFFLERGAGYPHYGFYIDALVSGQKAPVRFGISYSEPQVLYGQGYVPHIQPQAIVGQEYESFDTPQLVQGQSYTDFMTPNTINGQGYLGYVIAKS